jgi:hypothetical protein
VRVIGVSVPCHMAHASGGARNRRAGQDHLAYLDRLAPLLTGLSPGEPGDPARRPQPAPRRPRRPRSGPGSGVATQGTIGGVEPAGAGWSYAGAATRCSMAPSRSTSIRTTSPGERYDGGVRAVPTPAGVPVVIRSPGSRVNWAEQ